MSELQGSAAVTFARLSTRPESVELVAGWWFGEWGHMSPGRTLENELEALHSTLHQEGLPIRIVALENGAVVGAAVLKLHEMRDLYPDREYWLGNVFVERASRGRGIASALAMRIVQIAEHRGIGALHLQTLLLNGGLYEKLGWTALEQVHYRGYDALVMVKTPGGGVTRESGTDAFPF
jgi:GNAT superfamily N-acetyltransferase